MEGVDADHSSVEFGIRLYEFPERLRRNIAATRQRDVRMPWAQLRFDAGGQRGFLHALVDLEKVRMRFADADPDNFRSAFCRERTDAIYRQKECAELDRAEFFPQLKFDVFRHVAEEAECQMHLVGFCPSRTANVGIKTGKQLAR